MTAKLELGGDVPEPGERKKRSLKLVAEQLQAWFGFEDCGAEANEIEEHLRQHQEVVDKVQSLLLWRNPIGLFVVLVTVNFLFAVVRKFKLEFLPVCLLLMLAKTLVGLAWSLCGEELDAILFPNVKNGGKGEWNRVRPLSKVAKLLAPFWKFAKEMKPEASWVIYLLLFTLVLVLRRSGSFWVGVALTNGALLLPGILMRPPARQSIE